MLTFAPRTGGLRSTTMTPFNRMLGAWVLGLACTLGSPAQAGEAVRVVESCVSPDRLVLAHTDPWVALDDHERASVFEQMMRRYPVLQNDGVVPSHILLWRQPGGAWLYVTLLAHPAQPGQMCFTATVVARGLDITTALLQKYFALRSAQAAPAPESRLSGLHHPAARS